MTSLRDVGYDASYKILLIGESGVGKTALIKAMMGDKWTASHMTTVGIDFVAKKFEVDGAVVQLQIWDTAGQERFRTITRFQYRGTKGLLLVYDISNGSSFSMMSYWLESIDREIDRYTSEPVPVFIVGNKCDLDINRCVSYEQGKKLADEHFVHGFMETSAKEGTNVNNLFHNLAETIAEIHNPKILNAYQSKEEKVTKMVRKTSQIFVQAELEKQQQQPRRMRRNVSRIKLGYHFEQEPSEKSGDKCTCG